MSFLRRRRNSRSNKLAAAPAAAPTPQPSSASLGNLFNTFADEEEPEIMGQEGLLKFLAQLGVDPADKMALVVLWKLGSEEPAIMKRDEFISGMQNLGCSTMSDLKRKVKNFSRELMDARVFKKFYKHVFDASRKAQETNKRTLPWDHAFTLLRLLVGDVHSQHVEAFGDFIETEYLEDHPNWRINADQWMSFLDFAQIVNAKTLDGYDDDGAWPVLFDEFVEYLQKKN